MSIRRPVRRPRRGCEQHRRKSKDRPDEILLAAALAAAKSIGLEHCTGGPFEAEDESGEIRPTPFSDRAIVACCAAGALELAGKIRDATHLPKRLKNVWFGNDSDFWNNSERADRDESLGWAFREAMTL